MNPLPLERLQARLEASVAGIRPLSGGDICDAFLVELDDGRRLFVKTRAGAPVEMFPAEARGLEWLAETGALRLPSVVAAEETFLALEFIDSAPGRHPDFDERLGHGLATLHRVPAGRAGWERDNFIGPLRQTNTPCEGWAAFYIERRLKPRLEEALAGGRAPAFWRSRFDDLFGKLHELIPEEPLSRLHGDLWSGNLLVGPEGEPCLIDPAVYVGHREVDLAMMRLFGGFSSRVFSAYQEAYPVLDGFEQRVYLYQLYPLLVHVNLFGGGYVGQVERALERLG